MATGQTILDLMEVLMPELQLQSGETNVTNGLIVLNAAQDYMESVLALQPDLKGDKTGTITTTSGVETTTFPAGLMRIDKIQLLDAATSVPVWSLRNIRETGGHINTPLVPTFLSSSQNTGGAPIAYYTDGTSIYWLPIPDQTYTLRWYGFQSAADITAGGTFAYPDICMLPLAIMAVKIYRIGMDDDPASYVKLAEEVFEPVVQGLANFNRDRAPGYEYTRTHLS